MTKPKQKILTKQPDALFGRVAAILDQARGNVVRAVNTQMVLAYWLIGREIVQELQGGEERAAYGQQIMSDLSKRLAQRYGEDFSIPNLQNFRKFYLAYSARVDAATPIQYPSGTESSQGRIQYPLGRELMPPQQESSERGALSQDFSPQLTWSHYRALMRVDNVQARDFYEREAIECGWSKVQLERQIHSFYFERIVANQGVKGLLPDGRKRLPGERIEPMQVLKSPLVLEFLGIPDPPGLHESKLEQAIINNLQNFLLELGKGFSFVARQKHIRFDDDDYYVDLVFYNYVLKCFVLLDLKMGKLTHADIGQMDGYVRLFEDQFKVPGDNPTIGLLLCSDKSKAVAKYSILNESKQIFASKYMLSLPTEEQLRLEIERERRLIESALEDRVDE
jgi:predicted nuclease of restriction endonuclease-like (RecB) superfamily